MKVFVTFFAIFFMGLSAFMPHATAELYAKQTEGRGDVTGLDIPRFVSLRSGKVYMRSGPGVRYPVKWVYVRQNFPVEIIQEFDTWRKIRDAEGVEGWVHQSLLSGRRYVSVTSRSNAEAYESADKDDDVVMRLEPNALARLLSCDEEWCEISASGFNGWLHKNDIWGVYALERIN